MIDRVIRLAQTLRARSQGDASRVAVVALALVAFALRVYHLGFQSLWRDEVDAVVFAQADLPSLLAKFLAVGENGPFYFTILHYWIALAGDSEFAIRFLSATVGVALVPLTYAMGKRVLGPRAGLLAAAVAALSPYYVWYSQEAKMYTLLAAMTLLSMYLFYRALEENSTRLWVVFVAATSLSLYVHFFSALILICQAAIFIASIRRYMGRAFKFGLSAAALTLPYVPLAFWQLPLLASPPASPYEFMALDAVGTTLLFAFSVGFTGGGNVVAITLYTFLLLCAVVFWRGADLANTRQRTDVGALREAPLQAEAPRERETALELGSRWPLAILVLYLLVPLLAFYGVSLRYPMFTERYLIIILPPFQILVGAGLYAVLRRSVVLFVGCATLVLIFSWTAIHTLQHTPIKANFRAAVRYYEAAGDWNDAIMTVMPYNRRSFDYYHRLPYRWVEPPYTNQSMTPEETGEKLQAATGGVMRLWLFIAEEDFWDRRALVRGWLDTHARLLDDKEFVGVRLRYYELP